MAQNPSAAAVDYHGQVIGNCHFISHKNAGIKVITAKEPTTGKFRATAIRQGRGRREKQTVLFSGIGVTPVDAFEALHTKSAEAVYNHISTFGYERVPNRKDAKSWDGSTAGSDSDLDDSTNFEDDDDEDDDDEEDDDDYDPQHDIPGPPGSHTSFPPGTRPQGFRGDSAPPSDPPLGTCLVPVASSGPPMQAPGLAVYHATVPMPMTAPALTAAAPVPSPTAALTPGPALASSPPPPLSPPRDLCIKVTWEDHDDSAMIFVWCAASKQAIGREAARYVINHRDSFRPETGPSMTPSAPQGLRTVVKAIVSGSQRYDLRPYGLDDLSRICGSAGAKDIPLFEVVVSGRVAPPAAAPPVVKTAGAVAEG